MIRQVARKPWKGVDQDSVRTACQAVLESIGDKQPDKIKLLLAKRKPSVVFTSFDVMRKCGNTVGSDL